MTFGPKCDLCGLRHYGGHKGQVIISDGVPPTPDPPKPGGGEGDDSG